MADGRARHLVAACEASRRALGVERIALYQLHAPDPRTPLATSVRALAALKRDGLVERIGLCNVDLKQLEEALRLAEIDAVQVELSVLHDDSLWNGVAAALPRGAASRCSRIGRSAAPTGARSWRATRCSSELAARHGATPCEIALAWLRSLSPLRAADSGRDATRVAALVGAVRALALDDEDRERLDERFPAARRLRGERRRAGRPALSPKASSCW